MSITTLTMAQIAKALNIPSSTVRYYREKFESYIPSIGDGRSRRYQPEAQEVIAYISELVKSVPMSEIEHYLAERFGLPTEAQPQQQLTATQQQSTITETELINLFSNHFEQQQRKIDALCVQVNDLTTFIEHRDDDRDKKLIETLRTVQEIRSEMQRRPWWKRLFSSGKLLPRKDNLKL